MNGNDSGGGEAAKRKYTGEFREFRHGYFYCSRSRFQTQFSG